jgi:hypothetical protein
MRLESLESSNQVGEHFQRQHFRAHDSNPRGDAQPGYALDFPLP